MIEATDFQDIDNVTIEEVMTHLSPEGKIHFEKAHLQASLFRAKGMIADLRTQLQHQPNTAPAPAPRSPFPAVAATNPPPKTSSLLPREQNLPFESEMADMARG